MKVTLGKEGLTKTWQAKFKETTTCCWCAGEARIGFVAHEGIDCVFDEEGGCDCGATVCRLHENGGKGEFWLHDLCAVAVYFCKDCLETTALYNQG